MLRASPFFSDQEAVATGPEKYPLDRYPRIRTRQSAEFERALAKVYGGSLLELRNPSDLEIHANFVQLNDISFGFAHCGTSVTAHFEEIDYTRLQMPLRGNGVTTSGSRSVVVEPDRPCVVSEGHSSDATYGSDLENLFLRIKSGALEKKVALLTGGTVPGKLEFEIASLSNAAMLSALQRLIGVIVQQLDDENSLMPPPALRELEEAIIVQLIFAARHNFSAALEREFRDADTAAVRRVEDYIEANWNSQITIEALVAAAGVSARTLFRTFERARGLSPMALVKKTRLERARLLLSGPDHRTSVTGIAFACGFSNLGQFARDYQLTFGELPSATLQKSRVR